MKTRIINALASVKHAKPLNNAIYTEQILAEIIFLENKKKRKCTKFTAPAIIMIVKNTVCKNNINKRKTMYAVAEKFV